MPEHIGTWDNPGRTERDEHYRGDDPHQPAWFVVERESYGGTGYATPSRAAAMDVFTSRLTAAVSDGEGYSPHDTSRRLLVETLAPIAVPGDDDAEVYEPDDEPLPPPEAALREVLGDDYSLIVHGPRVASLLES